MQTPTPEQDKPVVVKKARGPIVIKGNIPLTDEEGNVLCTKPVYSLCGCGRSEKLPFCDGTHKTPLVNG